MSRPRKEINWELVERRMEAGCTAKEIAASCNIDPDTFTNRIKEKYGNNFTHVSSLFYAAGDANIKFTQYMKALQGNIHMLILLGKERLNQGKDEEIKKSPYEDLLELRHENMLLKAEIDKCKELINGHQS
ncbi:MAG: hypothetical protein ABFD00_10420 [Chloroherpetonaceae bacterium]